MKLSKIIKLVGLAVVGGVVFEKATGKTLSGVADEVCDKVKSFVSSSDDLFEESDHPDYQVEDDEEEFLADLDNLDKEK